MELKNEQNIYKILNNIDDFLNLYKINQTDAHRVILNAINSKNNIELYNLEDINSLKLYIYLKVNLSKHPGNIHKNILYFSKCSLEKELLEFYYKLTSLIINNNNNNNKLILIINSFDQHIRNYITFDNDKILYLIGCIFKINKFYYQNEHKIGNIAKTMKNVFIANLFLNISEIDPKLNHLLTQFILNENKDELSDDISTYIYNKKTSIFTTILQDKDINPYINDIINLQTKNTKSLHKKRSSDI